MCVFCLWVCAPELQQAAAVTQQLGCTQSRRPLLSAPADGKLRIPFGQCFLSGKTCNHRKHHSHFASLTNFYSFLSPARQHTTFPHHLFPPFVTIFLSLLHKALPVKQWVCSEKQDIHLTSRPASHRAMAMISRRKIISRSQSELDYSQGLYDVEEEVWFSKDKLFQVSVSFPRSHNTISIISSNCDAVIFVRRASSVNQSHLTEDRKEEEEADWRFFLHSFSSIVLFIEWVSITFKHRYFERLCHLSSRASSRNIFLFLPSWVCPRARRGMCKCVRVFGGM